jgi:hypothetical protein
MLDTVDQSKNGSLECVLGVNSMLCIQTTHYSDALQLLCSCLQLAAVGCSWLQCDSFRASVKGRARI